MNRLLGQQPKLNTAFNNSPRSPSIDSPNSARSPMSTAAGGAPAKDLPNLARARSPSLEPSKRGQSPHIANQALSPPVSRKPVVVDSASSRDRNNNNTNNTNGDNSNNNNNNDPQKYQFDETPLASPRTSRTDLEMDPQVKLEDYDWAELEDQFAKRMEAFRAEEDGIWEEWRGWGEIFKAWASTISVHDEERASKRLRTRIAFTQGSEESLEAKRQHYIKVVQAFESALALLGSRNSAHNFI